jgi:hypothetical protein
MTTPNTNTPYAIITDAYLDAGKIKTGQVPSSEMLAGGMRRLIDLINVMQTEGVKLWLIVDTSVTLVDGQGSYTFLPGGDIDMTKPLRVIDGYYVDASDNRRPLYSIAWADWIKLPQPTDGGAVTQYFVDKQATQLVVHFWLTPDSAAAAGVAHVLLQTQVTNPTNLTETMAFPPEWKMYLHWGLADEFATGQPQSIQQRCAQKAEVYRNKLLDWDVEDAPTSFAPDQRYTQGSRFR